MLKCLHKLACNELPPYFNVYDLHFKQNIYAESCLVYQLVKMKNSIIINDKLILQKKMKKNYIHISCLAYT